MTVIGFDRMSREFVALADVFRSFPYPAQHLLAHHEADHLDRLHHQGSPPMQVAVAFSHDKPGRPEAPFA
jgi:hypothetical protein